MNEETDDSTEHNKRTHTDVRSRISSNKKVAGTWEETLMSILLIVFNK